MAMMKRLLKNLHPTKQRADDFVGGQVSLKPVFKAVKWAEDDALIGCAGECCARKAWQMRRRQIRRAFPRAIFSACRITASVRSSEAPSGSCTTTMA